MNKTHSVLKRTLPPLAFSLALALLLFFCGEKGFTGLPPVEKRYLAAKARINTLKDDAKLSGQREPWEKLIKEFNSIYDADPSWPNRPAALFKAAESMEELARYSCSRGDARKAIAAYENLALRHASSRLADDALYRAARLRAATLKDDKGALNLIQRIKRQYPSGDMLKEAVILEKALQASSKGKAAPVGLAATGQKKAASEDIDFSTEISGQKIPSAKFKGDAPLAYKSAVSRMESLKKDKLRACWRQPWENLRNDFLAIHNSGKNRLAPGALYHAAACQEILAKCSRLDSDARKAIEMFSSVAASYPAHSYSDDALFHAALLQRNLKKFRSASVKTLEKLLRDYPGGDMAAEAKKRLSIWQAEDSPQLAALSRKAANAQEKKEIKGELQVLSWNTPGPGAVEIALDLSTPVKYEAKLLPATKKSPAQLSLELKDTTVVDEIRKGVRINGSLLKGVKVKSSNGSSILHFELNNASHFDTYMHKNPPRLVVSILNTKKVAAAQNAMKTANANKISARQVSNMASQLGLTVHRVFIDAGHGGKDPGTAHNSLVERNITLDIARRVGTLLKANGLEVVYSREKDQSIALSKRTMLANKAKADLFVSIHVNAHASENICGFETYFLNLASNRQAAQVAIQENAGSDKRLADLQGVLADVMLNARVDESKRLAADIQRLAIFRLKKRFFSTRDNGVKSAPFHVLLGAQMPAVLIETGYCTNSAEAKNLAKPEYRHALAEGIAEGILAYKDRLLRNRTANSSLTETTADAI